MSTIHHTDPIDQLDALVEDAEPQRCPPSEPAALPILVALTRDELRGRIIEVAIQLAGRRGAIPTVAYVLAAAPTMSPDGLAAYSVLADELANAGVRRGIEAELRRTLQLEAGAPAAWPMRVELGDVPTGIVQSAARTGAGLILMGLGHHNRAARVLGNDTLREVIARNAGPVLGVRPGLAGLPRRVVAAVDFSSASRRAAHLARRLMDERGVLYLVHVQSPALDSSTERSEGARLIQARGVKAAFAELAAELEPPRGMTIATVTCQGGTVAELKRFCEGATPDLLAIGRQRHGAIERLLVGSVTAAMVQDGRWSVLVTPPGSTQTL